MNTLINKGWLILFTAIVYSCSSYEEDHVESPSIIPEPKEMVFLEGSFKIDKNTTLYYDKEFQLAGSFLKSYLKKGAQFELKATGKEYAHIVFAKDDSLEPEAYKLDISGDQIYITSASPEGAFWAAQSLRQLLPNSVEKEESISQKPIHIPRVTITDVPRFKYRGMHLDVGRHFFDKEFIKEYISYLSLLKMNYFHWHLTEDQGWRIEIKQYPDLTSKGAYREETLIGHYNDNPQQFDGKKYGGYYTQEEIKEIVAFATQHNVTIIPEIEMPGHAQAAISAYPELGCTGEQVPVATKWGVFENIYCPNEKTFTFLENVLTEVMDLFPGDYIHIGGDEAPKKQWKNCSHCQQLIKDLNLKDENGLQSYFIREIEAFVNSKGKKIIGWDEILEGGLAPNATVMSWRGVQGAVEAATEGHDVILTPTSHAYFDYYQATLPDEPLAIGGFLPLKKVYSFNPISEGIPLEKEHHVLGAQGNVWTEYMPTANQVEYMAFPRILAMSEVVWRGPSENVETDYPKFLSKVEKILPRLQSLDINYANHLYDITGKISKENGAISFELSSEAKGKPITYSINDSKEIPYTEPLTISNNSKISASIILDDNSRGRIFTETINFHKGIPGTISIDKDPHPAYSAGGKKALLNGVSGSDSRYGDAEWLGFWGEDLEITIDFDQPTEISTIGTRFYDANGQWIYAPKHMAVRVIMENGEIVANKAEIIPKDGQNTIDVGLGFSVNSPIVAKKITILIPNYGTIPEGMQGAGNKAWTFIDEIVID